MEFKEQYKRIFVIFEEYNSGFGFVKDKMPLGYMKIDLKEDFLKLSIFVQNLKRLEEGFYKAVLIGLRSKEPEIRELGKIRVNEKGKGELVLEMKGQVFFNIQDYDIIVVTTDGFGDFSIPLIGFLNKRLENPKEELKKVLEFLRGRDGEKDVSKDMGKANKEEDLKLPEGEFYMGSGESKGPEEVLNEGREEEDNAGREELPLKEFDTEDENNINYGIRIKEYIKGVVKYLKEVKPFEWELEGYRWWMVDWGMIYGYPNRYLIGLYYDEKGDIRYIVYGMPGRFCLQEQPFGGLTGFNYWHPVKGHLRKFGEKGYWLLHIDAETGNIVYPLKPTPPPVI